MVPTEEGAAILGKLQIDQNERTVINASAYTLADRTKQDAFAVSRILFRFVKLGVLRAATAYDAVELNGANALRIVAGEEARPADAAKSRSLAHFPQPTSKITNSSNSNNNPSYVKNSHL